MKPNFKKILRKIPLLLFLVSFLLTTELLNPKLIRADGMMIKPDPYSNRWDYLDEENQQAFINYQNGLQKMILTVGMEETNSDAVWIFPVPAEPENTAIDVFTKVPRLNGEEISKKAKSNLLDIKKALPATQLYTIPFINWWGVANYKSGKPGEYDLGAPGKGLGVEQDVIVHEHLDKKGLTTEIITAKNARSLYSYLQNKNLDIEIGAIPVLDHYIGKQFTFVVSWISKISANLEKRGTTQRGVFVTFPTKKIYYPLIPTSVYGSKVVPATIRILGHKSPEIFENIKPYTETEYFIDDFFSLEGELETFYKSDNGTLKYTKIEIEAPSKFLKQDLWVSTTSPLRTYCTLFFAQQPFLSGITLLALSSVIASLIIGLLVFRELRSPRGILKLGLIGFSNCLSIIGLISATSIAKTKTDNGNLKTVLKELKEKGYPLKRRIAAVLFISSLPILTAGTVLHLLTQMPAQLLLIPTISLIPALLLKKIKKEDKPLFKELKSSNYSTWTLLPVDKSKYIFVPLFSLFFLFVSLLVVKIVKITV